jgi:hypothetical protein
MKVVPPNMRYSGPQLLSSCLHGASAVGKQVASSLARLGPLGPLSSPLGAGVPLGPGQLVWPGATRIGLH